MSEFEQPQPYVAPVEPEMPQERPRKRVVLEWIVVLLLAVTASLVLRTYAFQTFYIPSGSMEPTLQIGDRIVVDKLSVRFGTINRGDIVVFRAPPSEDCGAPVVDLVKRVVGLPGDKISSAGNAIIINGKVLDEAWTHNEPLGGSIRPQTVPAHAYFMVGDNHPASCDSRMWGVVKRSYIIGKAFIRIWPVNRLGAV